jgi:Zn-dependent peptidase ImmA (M78 family)
MSASITVKPGILAWARETLGLSQKEVIEKAKIDRPTLQAWENGEAPISLANLKYLANLYKRPLGVFFLPAVPNIEAFPPDFRTLDSTKTENLSPQVRLMVRRAQRNREIYKEILELLEESWKDDLGSVSTTKDPEKAAQFFREKFEISLETQFSWADKAAALKQWINILEGKNVLVAQGTMPIKELRAFCLRGSGLPPAIVLNTKDDEKGRIFSLWHEFGHLLVPHTEIQKLIAEAGDNGAHKLVEKFANHFAGAFLVPRESLLNDPQLKKYLEEKNDYILSRIAGRYRVSSEVILRRLVILGLVEDAFYGQKKAEFDANFQKRQEEDEKEDEKSGFQTPSSKAFQSLGVALTGRLFEAQGKGKVSASDIATYFEVKTKHFGKIKELLDKRTGT